MLEFYNSSSLVGIVVNYFYGDYAYFNISLPEFAVPMLTELAERGHRHALPPDRLRRLMEIYTTNAKVQPARLEKLVAKYSKAIGREAEYTGQLPPQKIANST